MTFQDIRYEKSESTLWTLQRVVATDKYIHVTCLSVIIIITGLITLEADIVPQRWGQGEVISKNMTIICI